MDEKGITALAEAFRKGDRRSFKRLVDGLSRTLIAMAYRFTGDWEWARDLTQETWLRVHERIHSYDSARPFQAWLFTVHRNMCLSHLRKAWVQREMLPGDRGMTLLEVASSAADPEEELERREFHRALLVAMDELSESQRQIFIRVDLEGNERHDVARQLGIKNGTLRATLHFARRRLAAALRSMEEEQ